MPGLNPLKESSKNTMRRLLIIPAFALVVTACTAPPEPTPTPAPSPSATPTARPTLPPPTATAAPEPLTETRLRNGEYHLAQGDQVVRLVDGRYEAGAGVDDVSVRLLDPVALGDLNGDGVSDAAVLLAESHGGSGVFVSLVGILNQGGQPAQAGAALIDDRPRINALAIQGGAITVDALVHGPNDPMCCPAWPVTETYQLLDNRMTLVQLTSQTADGQTRAIHLDAPAAEAEVTAAVAVQGRVTIAPFENNLTYVLYDAQGSRISQGPIAVKADTLGGPGIFETQINLAGVPAGTALRVEIVDISAVDGSPLALASAGVIVR